MTERTTKEIAQIFAAAGDSVTLINTSISAAESETDAESETAAESETDAEWKARIKRNVEHLEIIKAYKKEDDITSIWTSEDFTAIDKAIVDGKKIYS